MALVEMDKLGPRLREEAVGAVWEGFVQVATDHGPQQIRGLRDALIAAQRNSDQRRGDALVQICRRAADAGPPARPHPRPPYGSPSPWPTCKPGPGPGQPWAGQLLGIDTIRRIACDAMIIPVLMGGKAEILDVGRAKRLFTGGLLAAIRLRDKGCTIPGCTAPAAWADAHYLIHWVDGGPTSLLNGALICPRIQTIARDPSIPRPGLQTVATWHGRGSIRSKREHHYGSATSRQPAPARPRSGPRARNRARRRVSR